MVERRYYYAYENNTLCEKSHLLCTKADLITIQGKFEKNYIVEQCTQERQNTKWRFNLITNVTIFAALLKNVSMGWPESVLPEPLLSNPSVRCLLPNEDKQPHKDHLCLFRALAMGTRILILILLDSSPIFYQSLDMIYKVSRNCNEGLALVEEMIGCNIFN